MINILTHQPEADQAFRRWVNAMTAGSTPNERGWVVDGTGVIFSNYGHGEPGTIEDQVMMGVDTSSTGGIVKIVRPITAEQDKHKLTIAGRDEHGHVVLLREGWLKKNRISSAIRENFSELSGLVPVPVSVAGQRSIRDWYVVVDLNGTPGQIVSQTVDFTHACSRARSKAGGRKVVESQNRDEYHFGLDEKGRLKTVEVKGGTKEVEDLQGYVSEALKAIVGPSMTKPTRNGYAVDAMISAAKILVEIKTGTSPHDVYEAVGQLTLYPSLISLPTGLAPVLLIPDKPGLRPFLAAALATASIEVHFYSVGRIGKEPKIKFTQAFLNRCREK